MAKDTYYFSHDYEPLSDPKLLALVGEYGAVGYGIYWRVVEMLHSDDDHRLQHERYIYASLAKQLSTSVEQVEAVLNYAIEISKLFVSDGAYFWSERVFRNINKREDIRDAKRKAGLASAEARKKALEEALKATHAEQESTPVEQNSTEPNKGKERKGKERKDINYKKIPLSEISISDFPEINETYLEVAKAFNELFRKNLLEAGIKNGSVEKAKGASIDDIRLIIENDKYTIDDLRAVFEYLKDEVPDKNGFAWKNNILSTAKLRVQMEKLKIKLNGKRTETNRGAVKEATSWAELADVFHKHFGSSEG